MNDPNAPLAPDVVDELLSAELDGELARAAEDLGLSAADAQARLDATTGVTERRAELLRARDALGAAPAEMDELLGQRLVAKALRASEQVSTAHRTARAQRRRVWLTAGGIAAAVLVVLGLVVAVRNTSNERNSASSGNASDKALLPESVSSAASTPNAGPTADSTSNASSGVDLGDVSDGAAVRQKVLANLPNESRTAAGAAAPSTTAAPFAQGQRAAPPTAERCRNAIDTIAPNATVVLDAHGTYAGTPVGVFVVTDGDANRILLVMTADCKVVNEQLLN